MNPIILLAIIGLTPVIVLTLFKVNAATAFLALCLGNLLGTFIALDLVDLLRGYIPPNSQLTAMAISLILLWLPVFLVVIFMAGTISAKQRLINLLPAISVGLVGILLTVPFLTPYAQVSIHNTNIWEFLKQYQALVVVFGTVSSLLLLRMRAPFGEHHKGKHHLH